MHTEAISFAVFFTIAYQLRGSRANVHNLFSLRHLPVSVRRTFDNQE